MNKISTCTLFLLILPIYIFSQGNTVSGFVIDSKTKEPLIGVNVYNTKNLQGTTTNQFGFYSYRFGKEKELNLRFSFVGYQIKEINIALQSDSLINVLLNAGEMLNEVEILGNRIHNGINAPVSIPAKQISLLPNLTGEPDLIKAYQFLPGIAGGNEGDNNLYVRGGSPDQNLILLDDVPLYYINHIGGLVSIFDENAISDMAVYKCGFPAKYGGRLSSVVDIRMKNGDMQEYHGEAMLGLISSKIFLEGPIIKNKASFIITARKSMTDLYMIPWSRISMDGLGYMDYSFYDFNVKLNYKLSELNRLYFSFYNGDDKVLMNAKFDSSEDEKGIMFSGDKYEDFKYEALSKYAWGNTMACLRWNKVFSNKLFSNLTLALTNYNYLNKSENEIINVDTGLVSETFLYRFDSGVFDKLAKLDLDYYPSNKHHVQFGGKIFSHSFNTGNLQQYYDINEDLFTDTISYRKGSSNEIDTVYGEEPIKTIEYAFYMEDSWNITEHLKIKAGLHLANYVFNEQNYNSIQPRLSVKYDFKNNVSALISYTQMTQFIHMLTGSDTSTPTDIWLPVTNVTPPENSDQYAIGLEKRIRNEGLSFKIEGYYKTLDNLIDYKLGYSLMNSSESWYNKIETGGVGRIYGMELLVKKEQGKLTGWLGYTYSRNWRKFNNINNGVEFPYVYDRPHDISVVANYELNEKVTFSGTWEYRSGRRMTIGNVAYNANALNVALPQHDYPYYEYMDTYFHQFTGFTNEMAIVYGTKNNYKLQNYHKLNLSVHFKKQKKHGVRKLTLGIQNAYNRKNPYNVYYKYQKDGSVVLQKITLFPIMPNISYSFKF